MKNKILYCDNATCIDFSPDHRETRCCKYEFKDLKTCKDLQDFIQHQESQKDIQKTRFNYLVNYVKAHPKRHTETITNFFMNNNFVIKKAIEKEDLNTMRDLQKRYDKLAPRIKEIEEKLNHKEWEHITVISGDAREGTNTPGAVIINGIIIKYKTFLSLLRWEENKGDRYYIHDSKIWKKAKFISEQQRELEHFFKLLNFSETEFPSSKDLEFYHKYNAEYREVKHKLLGELLF